MGSFNCRNSKKLKNPQNNKRLESPIHIVIYNPKYEKGRNMSIYVIADLHLSFKNPKPMNIFGENWENHEHKIKEDWLKKVKDDDVVVLPR